MPDQLKKPDIELFVLNIEALVRSEHFGALKSDYAKLRVITRQTAEALYSQGLADGEANPDWPPTKAPAQYNHASPDWVDPALPDFKLIWEISRNHGYAVGIHGSLKRDVDLIAVAWTETPSPQHELIHDLCVGLNARVVGDSEDKPLGRKAYSIQVDAYIKLIDLSVVEHYPQPTGAKPMNTTTSGQVKHYLERMDDELLVRDGSAELSHEEAKQALRDVYLISCGEAPEFHPNRVTSAQLLADQQANDEDRAKELQDGLDTIDVQLPQATDEKLKTAVMEAIAEALGEGMDCIRVWEAWSYGTMRADDFLLISEDDERLSEIADAAIHAYNAGKAENGVGLTLEAFEELAREEWEEICRDTNCHPLDIKQLGRRQLSFTPSHWTRQIFDRISRTTQQSNGWKFDLENAPRDGTKFLALVVVMPPNMGGERTPHQSLELIYWRANCWQAGNLNVVQKIIAYRVIELPEGGE